MEEVFQIKRIPSVSLHGDGPQHLGLLWQIVSSALTRRYATKQSSIARGTEQIKSPFREGSSNKDFSFINFNLMANCIAYITRLSPLHSQLAHFASDELFGKIDANYVKKLVRSPLIRVVSVGGGSGSDIIGFLNAFGTQMQKYSVHQPLQRIRAKIYDKYRGWRRSVEEVREALVKFHFGQLTDLTKKVNVKIEFEQADLTMPAKHDFKDLKTADVVLLVKVISSEQFGTGKVILEVILNRIKPGAILLFVDTKGYLLEERLKLREQEYSVLWHASRRTFKAEDLPPHSTGISSFEVYAIRKNEL